MINNDSNLYVWEDGMKIQCPDLMVAARTMIIRELESYHGIYFATLAKTTLANLKLFCSSMELKLDHSTRINENNEIEYHFLIQRNVIEGEVS